MEGFAKQQVKVDSALAKYFHKHPLDKSMTSNQRCSIIAQLCARSANELEEIVA